MRAIPTVIVAAAAAASAQAFVVPSRPAAVTMQQQQPEQPQQPRQSVPATAASVLGRLAGTGALLGLSSFSGLLLSGPMAPALADGSTTRFVLPPVDEKDKSRCQFKSSAMGQANAARDKLYDLRLCDLSGKDAQGFDLSGAIMAEATFKGVNFKEAVMSKAYAKSSDFSGADFSNAVVDRVSFEGSNLKGAIFANAVLSGTSFTNADLQDSDFTDAYLGEFDLKALCRNPTLQGTNPTTGAPTKESVGCKN